MLTFFGLLAAFFSTVSFIPYIVNVLRGKTQPERAGWFIWFVLAAVLFASQAVRGGKQSLWMIIVHMVGYGLIFLLSFRFGTGKFLKRDYISLAAAALGIGLWALTNEPLIALLIAIFVDAIGGTLIAIKAYYTPHHETLSTWVLSTLAGVCTILSVQDFSTMLIIYPIYTFLNQGIIMVIVLVRRTVVPRQTKEELSETALVSAELKSGA